MTELLDVLMVEIDGRRVGIPAAKVVEVLPMAELTPVHHPARVLDGLLNVRGEVLPVLSLRERLGAPALPPRVDEQLVRVRCRRSDLLVRVDRALDLIGVDPQRLEVPALGASGHGAFATPDGVLVVEEPERFLTEDVRDAIDALEP